MSTNSAEGEVKVSAKMALCLAAMTMVGIDGEFNEEELEQLRSLVRNDEVSFLNAFNFYNEHTVDVCMKIAAARLNAEQKKEAYKVLYKLAQVDRDFAISELEILKQYAAEFGLGRDFIFSVHSSENPKYNLDIFL